MMEARYKKAEVLELLGRIDDARNEWIAFMQKAEEKNDKKNQERAIERISRLPGAGDDNE